MLTAIGEGKKLSADYDQNQQLKGVFIIYGNTWQVSRDEQFWRKLFYLLFVFSKENEGSRRQGQKAERDCQLLLEW